MASISWLHLCDLHHGMDEQEALLPAVRQQLFEDLERLSEIAGPWDLVLFTGDLTQRGSREELEALSMTLERLFRHLQRLGSKPYLLAVPGNHDLLRPRPSAVVRALRYWHEEHEIQDEFWRSRDNEYRRLIDEAFAPFSDWLESWQSAHPPAQGLSVTQHRGALPGDFAATIKKRGIRVGVVGLNSAFLQLSGDDYEGRLHVDPRQLHEACEGDVVDWIERHHVNLLMTHHPPEWLHVGTLSSFRAEIAPPGWFETHLFGHMHEPTADFRQMAGATMQRRLQGASLFGLERWGDAGASRIHGYSAGRITIEEGRGTLEVWPRMAMTLQAGHRKLVPDQSFDLDPDGALRSPIKTRKVATSRMSIPVPAPAVGAPLQDPGGPYDPRWYVPPEGAVRDALSRLRQPGQPVAIWGPELFGKTWLLKHTLARLGEENADNRIVLINLRLLGSECLASLSGFLHELATQVAESLRIEPEIVDAAQQRSGTPLRRLDRIFRSTFLPAVSSALVLGIDQADDLIQQPWCDDFFGLLRAWSDEASTEPLSRLRLCVGMSTTPALMTSNMSRSPFANVASQIRLMDLSLEQLAELATLHGLSWDETEIKALMNLVGGHPFLARLAMVTAARNRVPLEELLDEKSTLFDPFLDRVRWRLSKSPDLLDSFKSIVGDANRSVNPEAALRLRHAGLVRREGGVYQLRYRLYERLSPPRHR